MELPEILDVVLQYLKVLAWPLVVFTLALVYRKPVITLLQRLKKYSGWGQTVELGDQARDLKEDSAVALAQELAAPKKHPAADTPNDPPGAATPPPAAEAETTQASEDPRRKKFERISLEARLDLFNTISNDNPAHFHANARRAVKQSWRSLLEKADTLARWLKLTPEESANLDEIAFALLNRGLINERTAIIAPRLSILHWSITHAKDPDLNLTVVADFVATAANLQEVLNQVLKNLMHNLAEQEGIELHRDDPRP